MIGIPLTGTSVYPARSLGRILIVGGKALSQVWLFIIAPLLGGAAAALAYPYLVPLLERRHTHRGGRGTVARTTATP